MGLQTQNGRTRRGRRTVDGRVEGVVDGRVFGWAWCPAEPESRLEVVVIVDGVAVATGVADAHRPSLASAGIGDGGHAFGIDLPAATGGPTRRSVTVLAGPHSTALPSAAVFHSEAAERTPFAGTTFALEQAPPTRQRRAADPPAIAGRWLAAAADAPATARRWLTAAADAPAIARRWLTAGADAPSIARRWLTAGADAPSIARRWLAAAAPTEATAPYWLLGLACAGYFAWFVYLTRHFGFFQDEFSYILTRRGWGPGALLDPVNQHLFLLPLLAYKVLFVTVGLGTRWPYQLPVFALHIACAVGLYVLAARRAGRWVALIPALFLLVLGAGFELELWGIGWSTIGALAAGIWCLIALEREDRRGDRWACVLLTVAIASYSIALFMMFAIGVQLAVARQWRRLWVVGVPLGLYLLWYAGYGQGDVVWGNLTQVPNYDVHVAAYGFAGLLGFSSYSFELTLPLVIGYGVLAAAVLGLGFWLYRHRRVPPLTLIGIVSVLVFWTATALARAQDEQPDASRYVYPSAVLILLAVIGLLRRRPVTARAAAVAVAVVVLVAVNGARPLRSYSIDRTGVDTLVRSELGAAQIAGRAGNPSYLPDRSHLPYVELGPYLDAVREIGSPAFSEKGLLTVSPSYEEQADATLIGAEGIQARPGAAVAGGTCTSLGGDPSTALLVVKVPTGGSASIESLGTPLKLWLRRFTPSFPETAHQTLASGTTSVVSFPRDESSIPWWLQVGAMAGGTPAAGGELAKVCVSTGS